MSDFIHLHNHTHYSLQDGACTVNALIEATLKHNMKSVAITDHGVLFGVIEFYKKAKKAGIKPIIGMEAYIVKEGSRFDRKKTEINSFKKGSRDYHHLILLAKNEIGYKNLVQLSTIGYLEGFYYKPRIDLEVLKKHKEGLICTSACAAGVVSAYLIENNIDKAKETALTYKEIFGDDFYLEIQDHSMEVEQPVLEKMPILAKELGIKLVATNDCHYIEKEHVIAHNILLHFSSKNLVDYKTLRYGTDQIYFKSSEEMKKLFRKLKDAIENTLEISEKINLELDFSNFHFPEFFKSKDESVVSAEEYLKDLTYKEIKNKFKEITPEIEKRLEYELNTINQMGFANYFLIVQDFISAAKNKKISVGPGRGSAAGSLVAFALGITNINPLEYNLYFERFLNPSRKTMPDIDIDFAHDKRNEVIEYVKNKYGKNCVNQIITFNTLTSKQVIRDVARVLNIPLNTVNQITKNIPTKFGKVYSIEQALNEAPELKWVKNSDDPHIKELIKHAKILEGIVRNISTHAAGVVITSENLSSYLPLVVNPNNEVVTQYNMGDLESIGLLKMDFLSLKTLTIIQDTIQLIKKNHNVEIDIDKIPFDDQLTFELFKQGRTTGVFQFESAPMKEYLKRLKPNSIKELAAINALYRPGPMNSIDDFIKRKFKEKQITYLHPLLEPILQETYGIIVYQEQVIEIANKIAGMSLSEADNLRKAMGKKDLTTMQALKVKFIQGAEQNNIDKKTAENIYDLIFEFANYGFNKSHAIAYSYLAYQTAYLKAHYPIEFLAANLKNEYQDSTKVTKFLEDCRKLKIKILPPNINMPSKYFDVINGQIIFGLAAIKNIGIPTIDEIISAKEKLNRDFISIFDFCSNVDTRIVNKRAIEALILAGAFDSLHKNRAQLFESIELILNYANKIQSSKINFSDSLFAEDDFIATEPELPDIKPWPEDLKLANERKVVGFYISDHPLRKYETEYELFSTIHLGVTNQLDDGETVIACGVITSVQTKIDKQNNTMAFITLDDITGFSDCIIFSKAFKEYQKYIQEENIIIAIGTIESSGDAFKININKIIPVENAFKQLVESVRIILNEKNANENIIYQLKNIISTNSGDIPVYIALLLNNKIESIYFLENYKISINKVLLKTIKELLGEDSIILKTKSPNLV